MRGWLGVQRFLHDSEYGIDFLRNGRKIELSSTDLFDWNDGEKVESRVPDRRSHATGAASSVRSILTTAASTIQKIRFDRNDPSWDEMVKILRGNGPLRPDKAADLGSGQNNTPLFLLFQAFRRSSPKPKVAGCYAKLLVVKDNVQAEEMARKFYDGVGEFQPDTKWYELVEEEDRKLLNEDSDSPDGEDDPLIDDIVGPVPRPASTCAPAPAPVIVRTPIASLSREFLSDETGLRWNVVASRAERRDPLLGNEPPLVPRNTRAREFSSSSWIRSIRFSNPRP